jgi:4-hydroxybenzoate polyprenyltransferase
MVERVDGGIVVPAPVSTRTAVPGPVALLLAGHPAPTVGVTVFAAILGGMAGNDAPTVALLAAAVLFGQLSIGWSNDRFDAARDAEVGRRDKPLAAGAVSRRTVDAAICAAVLATVVCSLSLGFRAGLLQLGAVACGWAYNLGAKGTALSWLPYALAFGALPGVATLALPHPAAPASWLVGAGACLGVVANLTNVLPDLVDDQQTGVRGAPHRLGASRCVLLSSVLLFVSSALIVLGPRGAPGVFGYLGLGAAAVLTIAGCGWALRHPQARATFWGLFVFVALQLALLADTSHHLR